MNISIKRRIYYGFSSLIFLFMIGGLVTMLTLSSHRRSSSFVAEVINPSIQHLTEFKELMIESKMYSTNWVFLRTNLNDKSALTKLQEQDYRNLKLQLNDLSAYWVQRQWVDSLQESFKKFEAIILQEKTIMHLLKSNEDYNNPLAKAEAEGIVYNEVFPKTDAALASVESLIINRQSRQLQQTAKLETTSRRLRAILMMLAITIVGLGLFLSIYFAKVIVTPIKQIRHLINDLGKGLIREIDNAENNDEIGEMVQSVNNLSKSLSRTATFAQQVGARNFDIHFEPLSDEDTLGKALVSMRDDLRTSQLELLEANRELNTFFNSIDDVFFSVDMVNKKVLHVSDACMKLYGYDKSNFISDYLFWLQLIYPDDKVIIEKEDKMFQRGETVTNQYRVIRKDGTIKWVENKIVPTLDNNGKLSRVDGITRDVTERRKAEAELKQSEDRYRQIVETAQEGIWMIDEENKTIFVNKKMCDILGYTQEEMIGRTNLSFKDEAGKKASLQQLEKRRQGINESHDSTFITKDGKLVYVHINTNPIFDEDKNYKGALAMMTDITQRKLDEEALKKSEANLRTIFNNSDLAYVLINGAHEVVSYNDLAAKFSHEHYTKQLHEGINFISCFPKERHQFMKGVLAKLSSGEKIGYEMNYTNDDGSEKWYEIKWANIVNKEKRNFGFLITSKDITEKKIARIEREKVTADLIQRNKDLQQFTYIVSHNLRAPVANIMGISNLLNCTSTDCIGKENESLLKGLSTSVKQLDNIILDLNDILKVKNPDSEKKQKVCFSSLVEDITSSISHIVDKEKVVINYNFSQARYAFTLKSYIYSIFYNLIVNSIKYKQPSTSPSIEIAGYQCDTKVRLVFRDNGRGIDMQKNGADIFMLYKRFDTSVEGKGIGLYMVKTAVETLGGTITLNSEVNKGSEFTIDLPLN